jgi:tetratricopeptide (TPR) repeat protein
MRARWLIPIVLLAVACEPKPAEEPRAPSGPLEEGKALFEQGQLDAALAKLEQVSSADSLYYQGAVWAAKAKTAPLPTPDPQAAPRKGARSSAELELKEEELRALGFFEAAIAQQDQHPLAHLALADLLAPHALARFEQEKASRRPPAGSEEAPDLSPDRIVQTYETAARMAPSSPDPVARLIDFATRVERFDVANEAHRRLIILRPEKPEPLIAYGDFLARHGKDPQSAVERYREAMIWAPDDQSIPPRIADVYVARGEELYRNEQYVAARKSFEEARKWVRDWKSEQGLKVQEYLDKLRR